MEVINNNPAPPKYKTSKNSWDNNVHTVYIGVMLIASGLIWLLHNLDVIGPCVFDILFSWQMLLVVIGGFLMAQKRWSVGVIVLAIGATFMVTDLLNVHVSFNQVVLPLLLIGFGGALLLGRFMK